MDAIILYLITAVLFFGLDFLGLRYIVKPVFEKDVGDLLAETVRIGPAFAFYAAYVAGVVYLVSWPAVQAEAPGQALRDGMIVGALAYGTYEFTNLATLKGWTWRMVATDLIWGTVLTGVSAWGGVMLWRLLG